MAQDGLHETAVGVDVELPREIQTGSGDVLVDEAQRAERGGGQQESLEQLEDRDEAERRDPRGGAGHAVIIA